MTQISPLSLKGEINAHHREAMRAGNELLHHAHACGELLTQVKELLKADKNTTFGNWVDQFIDFSYRSARDYMKLYNDLECLPKMASSAILNSADNISQARRLIAGHIEQDKPEPKSEPQQPTQERPPAVPFIENPDADPPPELEGRIEPEEPVVVPQASVVLDCFDRPVPDHFREAQATAGAIATQARRLDPILREVLSLAEQEGGEFIACAAIEAEIKKIKGRIIGACYGFECPKCEGVVGKPCKFCQSRGWVPVEKKGKLSAADKEYLGID